MARYTALRSWTLREEGADAVLVRHAGAAAGAYLAAVAEWSGAEELARLSADGDMAAFRDAAATADARGEVEGACALLRAGYLTARRRQEMGWAARLAQALAELLRKEGLDGARLWARRAERLRRVGDA